MKNDITFRIERDSLGEVRLPAEALYGAQTQRAVENFPISGLRPWRAFIWAVAVVKRAAAEVNGELGLLDGRRPAAIAQAAQEVMDGRWDDQFVVDPFQAGAGTSHHMNANEVIASRANDFRMLASGPSTGLDELRLPAVQPGSSIMPGKVNPVMAEMLNMAMFHVQGCDHTVALAAQAGQLELNVMMPVIAHNLFEMMQITMGAVRAFTERCVRGVTANRAKAEGWLERNAIVATALNPLIGYAQGAALVKEALARDLPIREVAVEKASTGLLRHRDEDRPVTAGEVDAALKDLRRLTEGGIIGGGAGG